MVFSRKYGNYSGKKYNIMFCVFVISLRNKILCSFFDFFPPAFKTMANVSWPQYKSQIINVHVSKTWELNKKYNFLYMYFW